MFLLCFYYGLTLEYEMKYLLLLLLLLLIGCKDDPQYSEIEIEGIVLFEDEETIIPNATIILENRRHGGIFSPGSYSRLGETTSDSIGHFTITFKDTLDANGQLSLKVIPSSVIYRDNWAFNLSPETVFEIEDNESSFRNYLIHSTDTTIIKMRSNRKNVSINEMRDRICPGYYPEHTENYFPSQVPPGQTVCEYSSDSVNLKFGYEKDSKIIIENDTLEIGNIKTNDLSFNLNLFGKEESTFEIYMPYVSYTSNFNNYGTKIEVKMDDDFYILNCVCETK